MVTPSEAKPRPLLFWAITLSMLATDQAIKLWTRNAFHEGQSRPVPWPGVFELRLTYNEGVAFGMLQGLGVMTAPIAVAIALGCAFYSHRARERRTIHVALGLLAAGSLGNLVDRLWLGRVTDMFWFRAVNFPVFNFADSCITVAAVLLILRWGREAVSHVPHHAPAEAGPSVAMAESPETADQPALRADEPA